MKFLSIGYGGLYIAESAVESITIQVMITESRNKPNPAAGFPGEPDTISVPTKTKKVVTVQTVSGQKFPLDEGKEADAFVALLQLEA